MKVLSNLFGPSTFGLLTQVIGVVAVFFMIAGGGVTTGLIRNVSAAANKRMGVEWLRASLTIHMFTTFLLAALAAFLFAFGGNTVFGEASFAPLLLVIGAAQALFGLGNIVLAYATAEGDVRGFAVTNIAGSAIYAGGVVGAAVAWGVTGAAYGLVLLPLATAVIALARLAKTRGLHQLGLSRDKKTIVPLLSYSAAMIAGIVAVPVAQILIRVDLGTRYAWEAVGFWQAIARFSDAYMQIYGLLFINFFLPTLSRATASTSTTLLMQLGTFFLFTFICGATTLYLFRDFAITLAYSTDFLPASRFVAPQLAADAVRVAALCFFYFFLAQGRTGVAIFSELYQGIAIYVFYAFLESTFGPMAAVYNQIIAYSGFLIFMLALFLHHRRICVSRQRFD